MHQSSAPLFWRSIKNRYQLIGKECKNCGAKYYPPKVICPDCRRKGKLVDIKLSKTGKIVSFSILHVAPSGFEKETPYAVGIIELDDGPRLTSQIVDTPFEKIKIGKKVSAVFRRIYTAGEEGVINYGLKFRVLD